MHCAMVVGIVEMALGIEKMALGIVEMALGIVLLCWPMHCRSCMRQNTVLIAG